MDAKLGTSDYDWLRAGSVPAVGVRSINSMAQGQTVEVRHVHILDDDPDERSSLAEIVAKLGFAPTCYADADQFLSQVNEQSAGCLILETALAAGRGKAVLETLAKRTIVPPIIISTRHADVPSIVWTYQIIRPIAFLQRHATSEIALLEAIQLAIARDDAQRAAFACRQELAASLERLSLPEADVLNLLLQGANHAAIAAELEVSRRTVENRRAKIMKKLGVGCFPDLVRMALNAGHAIRL